MRGQPEPETFLLLWPGPTEGQAVSPSSLVDTQDQASSFPGQPFLAIPLG